MTGWKKALLISFVLCSSVGCDQVTKDVARDALQFGPPRTLLNDSIYLLYAENPGVAFSIGATLPEPVRQVLLIFGVGFILLGMGIFFFRQRHVERTYLLGASLVMGGGLGNLIDRIVNDGHVIDFMMIRVGVLRTAIFNVADVLIITGVILLIYSMLTMEKPEKELDAEASDAKAPV